MAYVHFKISVLVTSVLISVSSGGYIPPGPKYKCPTLAQIWPCVCLSSNDEGLNLKCEDASLATLSAALSFTLQQALPVEVLHVYKLNTETLFGPLFEGLNISKLIIEDSPIQRLSSDIFYNARKTLRDLQIIKTNLTAYSNTAFQELKNLESLTLDHHFIANLTEPIRGLQSLKALRISNGNITEISKTTFSGLGIKLNRLDLHGNQLKDLPKDALQQLKNLEYFDIAFNEFTKLDPGYFNHLTKLTWFNGSHNSIPDFKRGAFARNNFLRVIYLTHNKLTKLDPAAFRGMRLLRRLYLSDNQITEVGRSAFASINKVGTIDLARNRLKVVDFQMFNSLVQAEILDLAENEIVEVKREAFSDLAYVFLNLSHNKISKFEKDSFKNCINITVLDLSHNEIKNFTKGTFDEFTYPTELRLDFNKFLSLGDIPFKSFNGLKILNVSYNDLQEVPKNTFPKLYELHTVDLSHNNISKIHPAIFTSLFSLRLLDLSHNNLTQLRASTFGTIPTLIELNLDYNRLSTVSPFTFTQLTSLRFLKVSHNQMKSAFQISPSLSSLNISNNRINSLSKAWPVMNSLLTLDLSGNLLGGTLDGGSFQGLGSLQELRLANNSITEVPQSSLAPITILQRLDLSHNLIQTLPRAALGRLPIILNLKLEHNNISMIEDKAFEGLLQLLDLNLSHNNLSTISVFAFGGLVSLRNLDLSYNALERTDNGTLCLFEDNLSLDTLDLSHNAIAAITPLTFPNKEWTPYRLREIRLHHNYLYLVTRELLIGTKTVKIMDLSSNHISEIRPGVLGNLTALESLNLSNNSIGYLEGRVLGPPPQLRVLSLMKNRLRKFPTDVLPRAPFSLLDLRGNAIHEFNLDFVPKIENGSRVLLNFNALPCDCRLIPVLRFFTNFRPKLSNFSAEFYQDFLNFNCTSSETGGIVHLASLDESQLTCDSERDPLAPAIPRNYDVEIRSLLQKGVWVELRWRVKSREDVTGFKLSMENWTGEEIWDQSLMYNVRSIRLELQPGTLQICIWPTYSSRLKAGAKVCRAIKTEGLMSEKGGSMASGADAWHKSAMTGIGVIFGICIVLTFRVLCTTYGF